MPKRSPFEVLGVDIEASAATIKARWRRLAREHHPDLTGGDEKASQNATRQMAEINAAYEELRDPDRRRFASDAARTGGARSSREGSQGPRPGAGTGGATASGGAASPGGPPRPRPGRPLTGRLDTSDTFAQRNTTVGGNGHRTYAPTSGPPYRTEREPTEPPRASDPTGPLRRARDRHFRPTPPPTLTDAQNLLVEFGKFHGHTLGEIAAFEPSYIDWIASTVTRDRDLVAAARVIKDDLDARGVPRFRRPTRPGPSALA